MFLSMLNKIQTNRRQCPLSSGRPTKYRCKCDANQLHSRYPSSTPFFHSSAKVNPYHFNDTVYWSSVPVIIWSRNACLSNVKDCSHCKHNKHKDIFLLKTIFVVVLSPKVSLNFHTFASIVFLRRRATELNWNQQQQCSRIPACPKRKSPVAKPTTAKIVPQTNPAG